VRFDLCAVFVEMIDVELLEIWRLLLFSHLSLLLLLLTMGDAAAAVVVSLMIGNGSRGDDGVVRDGAGANRDSIPIVVPVEP
jgi:hypothetical protein